MRPGRDIVKERICLDGVSMKQKIRCLLAVLVLCLVLSVPALAAQDITDWINEYLTTDVAYVPLYEAADRFALYGEVIYNELTGMTELSVSGAGSFAVRQLELADGPAAPEDEDEDVFEIPEGYVFVTIRCESREDALVCMPESFAMSPADKRAQEAAAQAALAEENAPEESPAAEVTPEPVVVATPEPLVLPEPEAKRDLFAFLDVLDARDYVYIIIILSLVLVALIEAVFLLLFRRRAENVARNYLRSKSQLEKTKRELSAAKSSGMQKDRELIALRDEIAGWRGEKKTPVTVAAPEETKSSDDYEYKLPDYEWKF